MSDWRQSTWGEEITLEYGKALRGYSGAVGSFRVFGTNGPIGWTSQRLAEGPGVILGRKGAYRGVHYSPDPFFVIDTAYYVVPKTDLEVRWLYYAIIHHQLGKIDDGSPIPSTTRAAVYPREIAVPSLDEQRAIADVLGALDDKIEQNRRTAQTLERLARAIFRAWFVNFEPVKAKAAGATAFPSMPQPVFDALPIRFVDSDIGIVPEGWEVASLASIANVGSGKRPIGRNNNPTSECNIPLYGGGGRMGYVPRPLYEKPILFTGRVGTLGLIFRTSRPSWPSDNTLIVEPKDNLFDFTYFALKEFDLITLNRGSTQPLLTQTDLKRQQFARPNDRIIESFASTASALFHKIDGDLCESSKLIEMRDYVLPKLLSGTVRVADTESSTEEAR